MTAVANLQDLADRFVQAQLHGDRREALALIGHGLAAGATVVELQGQVVRAAQQEIGVLWQQNRISIAQEHLATGISQLALARLFEHAPHVASNGKRVYVACVEGEQHDLSARLVADYLEHQGFVVRYFGPDVPTCGFASSVAAAPPDLVALSVTMSFHLGALRAVVAAVRAIAPAVPIVVGGHAIAWSPGLLDELGLHTAPADPLALAAAVRTLCHVP
jgi:methanogenic corrinoid protein MtbC1